MKKKLLSYILAAFCLFSCCSLVGCGGKKSEVYFLNFKPETAGVFKEITKKYEEEKGVKVKVVTAAANSYEQTLKSEIAKSNAPTIFQVNGPVGYDAWKDYCLDIKDSKLYSFLTDPSLALKDGDGVYAIPYVMEGYGIICNNAIMEKYFALPNKKTSYSSLDEINSFESLSAVVKDMTANLTALGLEGVFASTSLASGEDWRWQTHLLNVPLYYEFSEEHGDDPVLAGLEAKEVELKHIAGFERLFDLYIENSVTPKTLLGSKSVADSMAEFALGKAAMVQNGNWSWSQISNVSGNTVKSEDLRMLPLYIGMEGEGGQGLCIGTENYFAINKNADKEQQKASLEFLEWLFSSKTGKEYVQNRLDYLTPFNTFSEEEQPDDPLAKELLRYLNDSSYKTVPWVFTAMPGNAYKNAVGSALLEYVQGGKSWGEVEKIMTDKWKSERS